ncbi:Preprotein translocase subunit SecY [Vibrio parahaemolyticus]|uniref:Preprotein translocase subunit SecY n=1 Tax=Vibrio parahaemolyticus TaxID=670 RepID=UPI0027E55758|nr:Preprotein translocase subunit SecY [Vibrio parahaemolyticus]WMN66080.1 Preprotein translocase subunit SecY [Vibrio parahaemolyticus]WMN71849.1 Preprotein translocase subunit SecY [Vibrio parahaemolyticus]
MKYEQQIEFRYPKGRFAMVSVYTFTGAAILASTIFSLLLFLSIDDNPMMQVLFGGLAIIFEAGKFYAWYEYGERRAHRNYGGAITALVFYSVLAAISIGGSIGGINSATNSAQSHISVEQAKIEAFNRQIASIDKQIELNNIAAQKYIEMERIATGVTRIQEQNKNLREEQQRLAMERDSLPPVTQGSVIGLIDSLANAFGTTSKQAQLWLVVFLSILLDFFAAFFVGLIGEEQRFRHYYRRYAGMTVASIRDIDPEPAGYLPHIKDEDEPAIEQKVEEPEEPKTLLEQVSDALKTHQITCTKKAVAKKFRLSAEEVDKVFEELAELGLVGKKANHHYHWIGQAEAA